MNLILCFIFFLFQQNTTQTLIQGQIFDPTTKQPLSYVNIGVMNTSIGTVSDVEGNFELRFNEQISNAIIRFSMVGYQPITISIDELLNQGMPVVINMEKIFYEMEELSVSASRLREKRLGSQASSDKMITGWRSNTDGGERGIRIKIGDRPIYLKNIHFHVANNSFEKVLFRVHIRSIEDGMPGPSLLREDIIVSVTESKGWISVDLDPYNLVFEDDIAVTLQPVSTQGSCLDNCLHISAGMFRIFSSNWLLAKNGSEGEWIVKKNWSPGIYLNVYQ